MRHDGQDKKSIGKVVVVGAGYGGATAAKYLRLWSEGTIDVTLVDPNEAFISCPISNLVLAGSKTMSDITVSYAGLDKYGVKRLRDTVTAIDADKQASAARLWRNAAVRPPDRFARHRVHVRPSAGLDAGREDHRTSRVEGWPADRCPAQGNWSTEGWRRRRDVDSRSRPTAVRPGPYERACQIAWYLKTAKPKSKLIVLDANPDYVSKKPLFSRVFAEDYKGVLDFRLGAPVTEIDVKTGTLVTEVGDKVRGDVINYIPPQRAANVARDAGLITANNRWCEVDWTTMESIKVKGVHVLGDSTLSAPAMPKSGHMANQHGKAAAAAIVELLNGRPVMPPMMANTCYSFIDNKNAVHVCSVHRWVPDKKTLEPVAGSGGISSQDRASWALEGAYAEGWAQTIWADMLA